MLTDSSKLRSLGADALSVLGKGLGVGGPLLLRSRCLCKGSLPNPEHGSRYLPFLLSENPLRISFS